MLPINLIDSLNSIETGSVVLADTINNREKLQWGFTTHMSECLQMLKGRKINHVFREINQVADAWQRCSKCWCSTFFMAFKQKVRRHLLGDPNCPLMHLRFYSSKMDWKKLRPMVLKRIENRAKDYPVSNMIPVAVDVLKARELLIEGVTALLKFIPIKACKFCPEVYIGDTGHQIRSCPGFKRIIKDQPHRWIGGGLSDIIVPVETFHLQTMFQNIIKHDQRFDFPRVPAVLELCCQAGAQISDEDLYNPQYVQHNVVAEDLTMFAQGTVEAWDAMRLGVRKLLMVYPAKVCKHCSEVHIGPSGHKARVCGLFKFEGWRGFHMWKKAEVDDLVPPKLVWHRRPHDPPVLVDKGRGFYGHAPAVVELCLQAGARVHKRYACMLKADGLTRT